MTRTIILLWVISLLWLPIAIADECKKPTCSAGTPRGCGCTGTDSCLYVDADAYNGSRAEAVCTNTDDEGREVTWTCTEEDEYHRCVCRKRVVDDPLITPGDDDNPGPVVPEPTETPLPLGTGS